MAKKSDLVHSYCDAVEASRDAHPIQRARDLLPERAFHLAADLYGYTVCPYDAGGNPLPLSEPASAAEWIIFDNVYVRERGGRFPKNHSVRRARNAGFRAEGRAASDYDPSRGATVWKGAIEQWGPPPGFKQRADEKPAEPPVQAVSAIQVLSDMPRQQPGPASAASAESSAWAQSIVDETASLWRSLEGRYSFWRSGFAVFYSPVDEGAKVVIIGANPGGDASAFDISRASAIPGEHDYFAYDYPMARKMRDLFTRAGRLDLLQSSVKLNLNFFRSRDQNEWNTTSTTVRAKMESHSNGTVIRILERLRPAFVLCEGTATYDKLCERIRGLSPSEDVVFAGGGRRAYSRSKAPWGGCIAGMIHPTGARYSNETWQAVSEALKNDIGEL